MRFPPNASNSNNRQEQN